MTCPFFFVIIFHRKTSVRGTRTTRWERGIIMIQCAGVCTTQEFVTLNLSITYAECHSPHMFCFTWNMVLTFLPMFHVKHILYVVLTIMVNGGETWI